MSHGGARPGAGRKSNSEIHTVRLLFNQTISVSQWKEIIRRLQEYAMDGNMRAAQLLFSYRFGDPAAEPPPPESESRGLQFIEPRLVITSDDPMARGEEPLPEPFATQVKNGTLRLPYQNRPPQPSSKAPPSSPPKKPILPRL